MNHSPRQSRFVLGVAVALFAFSALGTSIESKDLEALTTEAQVIVRATVKEVGPSRWVGPEGGPQRITTAIVFERVEVPWKGDAPRTFKVVQPGGTVGPLSQHVAGMASFTQGEEVILFLHALDVATSVYQVHGMSQGKFTVEKSSDGKMAFVVPQSMANVDLVDVGKGTSGESSIAPQDLTEFRKRVRDILKAKPNP